MFCLHMQETELKNIIVTGGSKGIGRAFVEECLSYGHTVFVLSRYAQKCSASGKRCFKIDCDVTNVRSLQDTAETIKSTLESLGEQSIHYLVCSAGVGYEKPLQEITEANYEEVFETNVKGLMFTIKTFLPLMNENHSTICNISSIAGIKGFAKWSLYSASKFAVEGFTASLRLELRKEKFKVVSVRLGSVDTAFYEHLPQKEKSDFMSSEQIAKILYPALFTDKNTVVEEIFINNAVGDL